MDVSKQYEAPGDLRQAGDKLSGPLHCSKKGVVRSLREREPSRGARWLHLIHLYRDGRRRRRRFPLAERLQRRWTTSQRGGWNF
jgi:hypothetical protein